VSTRATWSIVVIAIVCLVGGVALSRRIEPGLRVQTVTLAGDTPALHFIPAGAGRHPIALLAHGYSATKEYLFRYGEALAAAGFECYDVDQPGHGASPRPYSFMESVRTLETVAQDLGPVDVFLGNSMGGLTGGEAVREGGMKPKLFIALGSLPSLGEHGPPLVLLAGQFDEVFPPALLRARTDARLVLSPWSDHGLEGYDLQLVNAAVEAACAAVGKAPPAAPAWWCWRLAGIVIGLAGAAGLALCFPQLPRSWAWGRGLLVATVFIGAFVLTTRFWVDAMPHPRYFAAQAAAIATTFLLLLGAGRLRVPRWAFAAVITTLWLGVIAVTPVRSLVMSHLGVFSLVLCVVLLPALLIGALLGRIAAHRGSRFDGDLAMAIIVGCALFQWGRAPRTAFEPPSARVAVQLDKKFLDACIGDYEFAPNNLYWAPYKFRVWRQGDHLAGQAWTEIARQDAFDFYPESETNFFRRSAGGQLTFVKNAKGEVTDVIFHTAGMPDSEGKKLSQPSN